MSLWLVNKYKYILVGGFNPLKNMKVSWDDEIPNIWTKIKHIPNHQPVIYINAGYMELS